MSHDTVMPSSRLKPIFVFINKKLINSVLG
jgi:hypothetical protein